MIQSSGRLLAKGALFAVLSTLLVSCGHSSTEDNKVNGVAASDYYNGLTYQKSDSSRGTVHHYLSTNEVKLVNGRAGMADLYLFSNNSFVLVYNEYTSANNTGYVNRRVRGAWKVKDVDLIIEGVGTGRGIKYNGVNTMNLKFDRNLYSPGLAGSTRLMFPVTSNAGPGDN